MAALAYDLGSPHPMAPTGPGVFCRGPPLTPPSRKISKVIYTSVSSPQGTCSLSLHAHWQTHKMGDLPEEGSYSFPPLSLLSMAASFPLQKFCLTPLSHQIVTVFKAQLIPFLTQKIVLDSSSQGKLPPSLN